MAVTTSPKKDYMVWMSIFFIVMVGFGCWGLYDYIVKIPHQQATADRYIEVKNRFDQLVALREERDAQNLTMSQDEIDEYTALDTELNTLAPDRATPVPPSKFDHAFQWVYILCLPCAPYFLVQLLRARGRRFRLDDDGTLHLPVGGEVWTSDEVADIDMSRWMRKSVAEVVHTDGHRIRLDDYLHRDMDRIVGAVAHRLHPTAWDEMAKPVQADEPAATVESDATEDDGNP